MKSDPAKDFQLALAAQPLPPTARTRSGIEFDPQKSLWLFRDGTTPVRLNFELLPEGCAPLLIGFKKTLVWILANKSPGTANSRFHDCLKFFRRLTSIREGAVSAITADDIQRVMMLRDGDMVVSRARFVLQPWSDIGAPGVAPEVKTVLRKLKLKEPESGVAVATLDPKKGPLTDLEFEAIQSALNDAYGNGTIDDESLLLCYLFMSIGARPVQLASLKCRDLIPPDSPDGDYFLNVPRAKQRGQLARSRFKLRRISRHIGEPLALHVAAVRSAFADRVADGGDAPIFPQQRHQSISDAPGFEYHAAPHSLYERVVRIFELVPVPSERVAGPMPVTPIRFRRTFATRAAEEGWPLLVIAELMDHSTTRSVRVYAGLTSRIRAQFSRKIAMAMAPLAMAFSGKLIRSENEASRPGAHSRIIDLRIDRTGAGMGSCGSHAHCGFMRPVACYAGCRDFEPWLDGPHEAALDYLLARRTSLLTTADPRIAANNDRAILGCAQVILRCRELRGSETS